MEPSGVHEDYPKDSALRIELARACGCGFRSSRRAREVWGDNIQGAIDYAEPVPTEGDEAFIDDTNYPMFSTAEKAAE